MTPRRGELWWAALDPTPGSEISKTRPCVIITRDTLNEHRRTVLVIPLSTSAHPHPPITIRVTCLGKPVVAVIDQMRAITKERLRNRIGNLSAEELESIEEAVRQVLDLV